jgi:hypothetical protein
MYSFFCWFLPKLKQVLVFTIKLILFMVACSAVLDVCARSIPMYFPAISNQLSKQIVLESRNTKVDGINHKHTEQYFYTISVLYEKKWESDKEYVIPTLFTGDRSLLKFDLSSEFALSTSDTGKSYMIVVLCRYKKYIGGDHGLSSMIGHLTYQPVHNEITWQHTIKNATGKYGDFNSTFKDKDLDPTHLLASSNSNSFLSVFQKKSKTKTNVYFSLGRTNTDYTNINWQDKTCFFETSNSNYKILVYDDDIHVVIVYNGVGDKPNTVYTRVACYDSSQKKFVVGAESKLPLPLWNWGDP